MTSDFRTDSHLYPPVPTSSETFPPVPTCSVLGVPWPQTPEAWREWSRKRQELENRGDPPDVDHPLTEPDAGSWEWVQRHKYDVAKVNRVGYGCTIHGILPSRGPDECVYARRCFVADDPALSVRCRRGWPCPRETALFQQHVMSARHEYRKAKAWLGPDEFEATIRDMAFFDLRLQRCSARCRDEGFVHTIERVREDGNIERVPVPTLSDRYETAAFNGLMAAWHQLTDDPRDPEDIPEPLQDWENVMRVQQLVREAEQAEKAARTD